MMTVAMPKTPQSAQHGGALKLHRGHAFGEVSIAPLQPHAPMNLPITRAGTTLAINYLTSGVAALSACSTGRGGARNRADRESHALTAAQIGNLKAAERHAATIGLPLTIHWEAAGVPLVGMARATGRFIDLMAKAIVRHRHRTAWVWVHENCGPKGGHCHLLAHVPADLVPVITGLQRGWLRRITGEPYRARVIRGRPIGKRLGIEVRNPAEHAINLEAALAYVLKGASLEAASQFGLERLEPGGSIIGRRCSTSQNIGAKARREAKTIAHSTRARELT